MHAKFFGRHARQQCPHPAMGAGQGARQLDAEPESPQAGTCRLQVLGERKRRRPSRNRDGAPRTDGLRQALDRVPMTNRERFHDGRQRPDRRRRRKPEHMPPSATASDAFQPERPPRTSPPVSPPPADWRRRKPAHQQRQTPATVSVPRVATSAQRQTTDVTGHDDTTTRPEQQLPQ